MKNNNQQNVDKVFSLEGCTTELIDGQPRCVTIVGVVQKADSYWDKSYTLSVGLSVIAPMDVNNVKEGLSKTIATGRALSPKTCLLKLKSEDEAFNKYLVNSILKAKLDHVIENPNRYIKVSPVKVKTVQFGKALPEEV